MNKNDFHQLLLQLDQDALKTSEVHTKQLDHVLSQKWNKSSLSASGALTLLRCHGEVLVDASPRRRVAAAQRLMADFREKGVNLDISHHNALLGVYLENEHPFDPAGFLAELGVAPNRITYQRLLQRYCQIGDMDGASKIQKIMEQNGIESRVAVYESLIMGHGRAGDLAAAAAAAGRCIHAACFAALARAQAEAGDVAAVLETISAARAAKEALSDAQLLEVVCAFSRAGHLEHVDQIIELVERGGFYNRDCKLAIYRLISAGHMAAALKLYRSMSPNNSARHHHNAGLFYLRQMIACGRPVEEILSCPVATEAGNPWLLEALLEAALSRGRGEVAEGVVAAMVAEGRPLRPHYWWPRLVQAEGALGMCEVLQDMKAKNVSLDSQTFQQILLPRLLDIAAYNDLDLVTLLNEQGGIAPSLGFNELLRNFLLNKQMTRALNLVEETQLRVYPNMLHAILYSVEATDDFERGAKIVKNIEGRGPETRQDHMGRYLLELCKRRSIFRNVPKIEAIVRILDRCGATISQDSRQQFLKLFGRTASNELQSMLDDLVTRKQDSENVNPRATIEMLEARLKEVEQEDNNPVGLLVLLLRAYAAQRESEAAERTWQRLISANPGLEKREALQTSLLACHVGTGDIEAALRHYKPLKTRGFPINRLNVLRLVRLMVDNDMTEDALEVLKFEGEKNSYQAPGLKENTLMIDACAANITAGVAQRSSAPLLRRFAACLVEHKYVEPSLRVLRPVVGIHLGLTETSLDNPNAPPAESADTMSSVSDADLADACSALRHCASDYGVMPYKMLLLRRLIRREDKASLQEILDLSTKLHGEGNSLFELAMAFLHEGRKEQAIQILQSPNVRISQNRVLDQVKAYQKYESSPVPLIEDLLEVTAFLRRVDRAPLFHALLQAYATGGQHQAALELWTRMQEEAVTPCDAFLADLRALLVAHGRPVPFQSELPRKFEDAQHGFDE